MDLPGGGSPWRRGTRVGSSHQAARHKTRHGVERADFLLGVTGAIDAGAHEVLTSTGRSEAQQVPLLLPLGEQMNPEAVEREWRRLPH